MITAEAGAMRLASRMAAGVVRAAAARIAADAAVAVKSAAEAARTAAKDVSAPRSRFAPPPRLIAAVARAAETAMRIP